VSLPPECSGIWVTMPAANTRPSLSVSYLQVLFLGNLFPRLFFPQHWGLCRPRSACLFLYGQSTALQCQPYWSRSSIFRPSAHRTIRAQRDPALWHTRTSRGYFILSNASKSRRPIFYPLSSSNLLPRWHELQISPTFITSDDSRPSFDMPCHALSWSSFDGVMLRVNSGHQVFLRALQQHWSGQTVVAAVSRLSGLPFMLVLLWGPYISMGSSPATPRCRLFLLDMHFSQSFLALILLLFYPFSLPSFPRYPRFVHCYSHPSFSRPL
jgi:hypothetical protein